MPSFSTTVARHYWSSLLDNVADLLADANALLDRGSAGRARTLQILAREELGKALWVHEECRVAWLANDTTVTFSDAHAGSTRSHSKKLSPAIKYAAALPPAWGFDEDHRERPRPLTDDEIAELEDWLRGFRESMNIETIAKDLNAQKQEGLYVDLDADGEIRGPSKVRPDAVAGMIAYAAQVALAHYDQDHEQIVKAGRFPEFPSLRAKWNALAYEDDGTPRRYTTP